MPTEKRSGIEYEVIYSRRKSVGVKINRDGNVVVHAPQRTSLRTIDKIIFDNASFIRKHSEIFRAKSAERKKFHVGEGSRILFLGKEREVVLGEKSKFEFDGERFLIPENASSEVVIAGLIGLYKELAKDYIPKVVEKNSAVIGVYPTAVKINSAFARWGSCSGKNSLNFSWRLIMADEAALEYVVVHELCHILHHNHSADFWLTVEKFCPQYSQCVKRLEELSARLACENWT